MSFCPIATTGWTFFLMSVVMICSRLYGKNTQQGGLDSAKILHPVLDCSCPCEGCSTSQLAMPCAVALQGERFRKRCVRVLNSELGRYRNQGVGEVYVLLRCAVSPLTGVHHDYFTQPGISIYSEFTWVYSMVARV